MRTGEGFGPPPFRVPPGPGSRRSGGHPYDGRMDRPTRFEHNRWLGDKRTQLVYDLDADDTDPEVIADIMAAETFLCFGPDTLAEARNRCYRQG